MPLPLLGLLAAGAGSMLAAPWFMNQYEDRMMAGRARRYQRATGEPSPGTDPKLGYDPTIGPENFHDPGGLLNAAVTPYDYNASLLRSGLLKPEQLGDPYGLQQLSNEGAYARAQLGEQGANHRQQVSEQGAWDRALLGLEPAKPPEPIFNYDDPAKFSADVDSYTRQGAAITAADAAIDFIDQYSGVGENMPGVREQKARIEAQLNTSALPTVAQAIMDAGAMSDEERPFFQQMAGGDFSSAFGDARGRAALEALIDRASEMQENRWSAFVNSNLVPPGLAGEVIEQRLGQFGIHPPAIPKNRAGEVAADTVRSSTVPYLPGGR